MLKDLILHLLEPEFKANLDCHNNAFGEFSLFIDVDVEGTITNNKNLIPNETGDDVQEKLENNDYFMDGYLVVKFSRNQEQAEAIANYKKSESFYYVVKIKGTVNICGVEIKVNKTYTNVPNIDAVKYLMENY